jgi:microsomal epoxide hydrolase
MMRMRCFSIAFGMLCLASCAWAQSVPGARDRYFLSSDDVRLHYLEAGPVAAHTVVFVPGWTMPAWIFSAQIRALAPHYHVIAFDPRGQGASEIAADGYNQDRRGQDIADLLQKLGPKPVVIVGWSLGVLDTLAFIHNDGDARIAGLVLIDNSVGENPPPVPEPTSRFRGPALTHDEYMHDFVAAMFHTRQSIAYIDRLTAATLRLPEYDARALLEYPVPRSYWRDAIMSTNKPVLYVVRPHLNGQAQNLLTDRPNTEIAVFPHAGHALFVDAAGHFNALLTNFLQSDVWPR